MPLEGQAASTTMMMVFVSLFPLSTKIEHVPLLVLQLFAYIISASVDVVVLAVAMSAFKNYRHCNIM